MTTPSITRRPVRVKCKACGRDVSGYMEVEDGRETNRVRPYRHERLGVVPGACRGSNRPASLSTEAKPS